MDLLSRSAHPYTPLIRGALFWPGPRTSAGGSVFIDGRGQQLVSPRTEGTRGEHWLMPTVVALLAGGCDGMAERHLRR